MSEAVNATTIVAVVKAVLLLKMAGNGGVILYDLSVEVGHPDGSIGPMHQVDRMAPLVGCSCKLGFLLARCPMDSQRGPCRFDDGAVDQVAGRFTNQVLPMQSG